MVPATLLAEVGGRGGGYWAGGIQKGVCRSCVPLRKCMAPQFKGEYSVHGGGGELCRISHIIILWNLLPGEVLMAQV